MYQMQLSSRDHHRVLKLSARLLTLRGKAKLNPNTWQTRSSTGQNEYDMNPVCQIPETNPVIILRRMDLFQYQFFKWKIVSW
jgi:hypothetical protein